MPFLGTADWLGHEMAHFHHPVRIPRVPPVFLEFGARLVSWHSRSPTSSLEAEIRPITVASSVKLHNHVVKVHRNALVLEKGVQEGTEHTGKVGGPVFVHAHTLGPREVQDVKLGAEPKIVKPYARRESGVLMC